MRKVLRTWIQGSCFSGDIRAMLAKYSAEGGGAVFKPAQNVFTADCVIYAGGADISPELYGEKKLSCTSVNYTQDTSDLSCWRIARRGVKYQVGICRGAQLLNALNGGKLWQHVDNHAGNHHEVTDKESGEKTFVSSLHHQGIRLHDNARLLAYTHLATKKLSENFSWTNTLSNGSFHSASAPDIDVEAFWYPESRCLGVQWHPEIGPDSCVSLFFKYFEQFRDVVEDRKVG